MDITHSPETLIPLLRKTALFRGLSTHQLEQLVPLIRIMQYAEGEIILHENDTPVYLYVLCEGEIEVFKHSDKGTEHRITLLSPYEEFGEIGLLDNAPRSASIRALNHVTLLAISIVDLKNLSVDGDATLRLSEKLLELSQELRSLQKEKPIYFTLVSQLSNTLSHRMRLSNELTVESMKNELEQEQTRVAMGNFMINVLLLIAMYIYTLKIVETLAQHALSTTIISVPLIALFSLALLVVMKSSGYPLAFYGLTLKGWKRSALEGVLFSVPVIGLIALLKWFFIVFVPAFHLIPVVSLGAHLQGDANSLSLILGMIVAYLIFTPLQELIVRGGLQSSMQKFLVGPNHILWAIIMSNVLFSVTHLHVSTGLALGVLLPGFFWGWMYYRHKTLVGVSISHLLVGGSAFFVFDIQSMLGF